LEYAEIGPCAEDSSQSGREGVATGRTAAASVRALCSRTIRISKRRRPM
jgi:hypothetical protein